MSEFRSGDGALCTEIRALLLHLLVVYDFDTASGCLL